MSSNSTAFNYYLAFLTSAESLQEMTIYKIVYSFSGIYVVLSLICVWVFSYIVSFCCCARPLKWLLRNVIKNNDRRIIESKRVMYSNYMNANQLTFKDWTSSRIKCVELSVGWIIVSIGSIGIFLRNSLWGLVFGGPIGVILIYVIYRGDPVGLIHSFITRFRILWHDRIRVTEYLSYRRTDTLVPKKYLIIHISPFSFVVVEVVNHNDGESGPEEIIINEDDRGGLTVNQLNIPIHLALDPSKVELHPTIHRDTKRMYPNRIIFSAINNNNASSSKFKGKRSRRKMKIKKGNRKKKKKKVI